MYIGLPDKLIEDTIKKPKSAERLKFVLNEGDISECEHEVGNILVIGLF